MKNSLGKYVLKSSLDLVNPITQDVSCIITSPPYGKLKDYGHDDQIGFGQSEEEYYRDLRKIFKNCFDLSNSLATLWIISDSYKQNGRLKLFPFELSKSLEEIGWILRDIVIWDKRKTLPWSRKGQLRNTFEYISFFSKSENYYYNQDAIREPVDLKEWWVKYPERYNPRGKIPRNIWEIPITVQGSWCPDNLSHFCPFPLELVERILTLATKKGDLVLDPFAGVGTVLAQAAVMGRKYLGFDLIEKYKDTFVKITLPMAERRWKFRKVKIKELRAQSKALERKIKTLRMLKYPKTLTRKIIKNLEIRNDQVNPILTAFITGDPKKVGKNGDEVHASVIIVCLDDFNTHSIQDILPALMKKPPLSKFGIKAECQVLTRSQFLNSTDYSKKLGGKLFLYDRSNVHWYKETFSLDKWIDQTSQESWFERYLSNTPPIISPLKIRQEVEKTWKV